MLTLSTRSWIHVDTVNMRVYGRLFPMKEMKVMLHERAGSARAAEPGPVITSDDLPLQRVYQWERERASEIYLVQPVGGGRVRELTWAEAIGEARRIAAYLRSLGLDPGSRIALVTKNCAHFFLLDLAIWMAGHVSVAIYPTV